MLSSLLAFCWFKQAGPLVLFSRMSSTCCFGPLFRKTTWLVRVPPMALVWKHVIYLEVAGWRHRGSFPLQSLNSLLRDVTLWHGLGLLQMVGFKASVQRTGARWRAQLRKQEALVFERFQRFKRESARTQRIVFKNSLIWTPPTCGWSNQNVGMGQEPRPCPGFLGLMSKWSNISLIPWKIQTYRFYICLVTHDAKV